jgi:hypothetical protein
VVYTSPEFRNLHSSQHRKLHKKRTDTYIPTIALAM